MKNTFKQSLVMLLLVLWCGMITAQYKYSRYGQRQKQSRYGQREFFDLELKEIPVDVKFVGVRQQRYTTNDIIDITAQVNVQKYSNEYWFIYCQSRWRGLVLFEQTFRSKKLYLETKHFINDNATCKIQFGGKIGDTLFNKTQEILVDKIPQQDPQEVLKKVISNLKLETVDVKLINYKPKYEYFESIQISTKVNGYQNLQWYVSCVGRYGLYVDILYGEKLNLYPKYLGNLEERQCTINLIGINSGKYFRKDFKLDVESRFKAQSHTPLIGGNQRYTPRDTVNIELQTKLKYQSVQWNIRCYLYYYFEDNLVQDQKYLQNKVQGTKVSLKISDLNGPNKCELRFEIEINGAYIYMDKYFQIDF